MIPDGMRWLKSMRSEAGGSMIEMAFIMALFLPIFTFGVIEVGNLLYSDIEVSEAAHAGASYVVNYFRVNAAYPATDTTAIAAAKAGAPDISSTAWGTNGIIVNCNCLTTGQTPPAISTSSSSCIGKTISSCTVASGSYLYVTVRAQATITPFLGFNYPGLGISTTIPMNGQAVMQMYP